MSEEAAGTTRLDMILTDNGGGMTRARLMESVQINSQREELGSGQQGTSILGMGLWVASGRFTQRAVKTTKDSPQSTPRKKAPPPSTSADSTSKSSAMAEVQSSRL